MALTAERLEVEVGADTSEAEKKLDGMAGDKGAGGGWTGRLAKAGAGAFLAIGTAAAGALGFGAKIAIVTVIANVLGIAIFVSAGRRRAEA